MVDYLNEKGSPFLFYDVNHYLRSIISGGVFVDSKLLLELFGYTGTFLIILSMTMTSIGKLRILNIAGSFISGTYSFISDAWPVVILNICLIVINIFKLIREKAKAKDIIKTKEA